MAKETVNNVYPLRGAALPQGLEANLATLSDSFLIHTQEFSPNLHVFRATDRDRALRCEMVLEVKESLVTLEKDGEEGTYLAKIVTCSLPGISLEKLNEKTGFDSYLQGILMFQFQLKILQQLLLFCEQQGAVSLIITLDDDMLDYIETYNRFFVMEEHVATPMGERTRIEIPTDADTQGEIIDFMDDLEKDFRKILWREQKANPAFQEYLKSYSCIKSFD
jgi:hypothetical protein